MNALVSVRNNQSGILSPTPMERAQVSQQLATDAAARAGSPVVEYDPVISTVSAQQSSSAADEVAAASASSNTETASRNVTGEDVLGKETFLQLLVMQMQNQDPLEPTDNSEMLAQLAQFSALEAQTNLNDSFSQMSSNIDQLNFMSASQMLGRNVEGVDIEGNLHSGRVDSVHLDGSLVVLNVEGKMMSMAGILRIEDPQLPTEAEQ